MGESFIEKNEQIVKSKIGQEWLYNMPSKAWLDLDPLEFNSCLDRFNREERHIFTSAHFLEKLKAISAIQKPFDLNCSNHYMPWLRLIILKLCKKVVIKERHFMTVQDIILPQYIFLGKYDHISHLLSLIEAFFH